MSFFILNTLMMFNSVQAISINSANIVSGGDCGSLLNYQGVPRIVYYAQYTADDGNVYPAYCLDKTKQGVNDDISYSVSVDDTIHDVQLWKIIINGYPYKTIQELGCNSKEEAFTATKQAIYCYIHGNNPNDYSGIGEAGNRTLNALKKILADAASCQETQISNTVKIVKESNDFTVDKIEKKYVSKVYSIQAQASISNYKVTLQKIDKELPEGIKITDLNNNSKKEFSKGEKFKVLIPIKNLIEEANFNIQIRTKINSKPVLYGKSADSNLQDYALTAATYEDATGSTKDIYYKNETNIHIIKQDKETKERLENVEFNILDENKKVIYANLKTNAQGEINVKNFLPGKYYLQETNAREGYLLNEKLIGFEIQLNETLTITIDNLFEEIPDRQVTEKEIIETVDNSHEEIPDREVTNKIVTETVDNSPEEIPDREITNKKITETVVNRLPVTGM